MPPFEIGWSEFKMTEEEARDLMLNAYGKSIGIGFWGTIKSEIRVRKFWKRLAKKYGFIHNMVRPSQLGPSPQYFMAAVKVDHGK